MKKETLKKIEIITVILLGIWVFAVCVYQLRYGIDVQDTSSYLTKFRYFFEKGTGGNALYYLLGEFFGSLVFHVFPTLYAMNVTGLIVWSLTGVVIYRIMRPYLSTLPLTAAVLGGLAFGASWVRCVNWNAWSVLFLSIGILFLLYGFETGKKRWFATAGFVLGINTFVRFPNLVLLAVLTIPVAIYYFNLKNVKASLKDVWKYLGSMVAGGAVAGIAGCVFSIIFLGFDKFLADLLWLLGSSGDKESKHNLFDMLGQVIVGAMDGARQWIKYGVIIFFDNHSLYDYQKNQQKRYDILWSAYCWSGGSGSWIYKRCGDQQYANFTQRAEFYRLRWHFIWTFGCHLVWHQK